MDLFLNSTYFSCRTIRKWKIHQEVGGLLNALEIRVKWRKLLKVSHLLKSLCRYALTTSYRNGLVATRGKLHMRSGLTMFFFMKLRGCQPSSGTLDVAGIHLPTDEILTSTIHSLPLTADIISTVEFDHTGDYLATGDKGGRVVLFERNESVSARWLWMKERKQH